MKIINNIYVVLALFLFVSLASCNKDNATPRKGESDAVFNPNLKYGTVTDIDGNTYKTIKIGTQTWMAQNLRVTHYQNGDPITLDSTSEWGFVNQGFYCMPNNNTNIDTIATYGLLYNGYAAIDPRNIAPKGWRIPSKEDVDILYAYLKSQRTTEDNMREGGRMKEAGTKHWASPNKANNSSGLTLLPEDIRAGSTFIENYRNLVTLSTTTKQFFREFPILIPYGAGSFTDIPLTGENSIAWGVPLRCVKNN